MKFLKDYFSIANRFPKKTKAKKGQLKGREMFLAGSRGSENKGVRIFLSKI